MGGAQPLAATMQGATMLAFDVDESRIDKRLASGYCDAKAPSLEAGLALAEQARRDGRAYSVGVVMNAATALEELMRRGVTVDVLTDQTSAHDMLRGYIPDGMSMADAAALRERDPATYVEASTATAVRHVRAMLALQRRGSVTFDYGNNIRTVALDAGVGDAFDIPGFIPEYIRPLFCEGKGPFRWVALSGDPADIARWLGQGARAKFGVALNDLVARGELSAPIAIGRDHLDTGSVASPFRETEAMMDGTDAVADWPILNALLNVASGASWVSFHHGGGVGIGNSLHAGQVIVADGTPEMRERLERVLTNDPGIGVARHADAGYHAARETAARTGIVLPMTR